MKEILQLLLARIKHSDEPVELTPDWQEHPMVRTIHESEKLVDFEKYLEKPRALKQIKTLYQLSSFQQYIESFKPKDGALPKHGKSAVFVELKENGVGVKCVLDYHIDYTNPTHCNHEIKLDCTVDKSFLEWSFDDNKWMSQSEMINKLKKHNNALADGSFSELLAAIEDVKSEAKQQNTEQAGHSGKSKSVFFKMINEFSFKFKPYFSMPFCYSTSADLYAQLDDNGRLQLKYSIRNQHKIHEQVAEDLRIELGHIDDLEVF